MPSDLPSRDNDYRFPPAPQKAELDRALWDRVMAGTDVGNEGIAVRLRALEAKRTELQDLIDELKVFGLEILDNALSPLVDEQIAKLETLAGNIDAEIVRINGLFADFEAQSQAALDSLDQTVQQSIAEVNTTLSTTLTQLQTDVDTIIDGINQQVAAVQATVDTILADGIPAANVEEDETRVFVTPAEKAKIADVDQKQATEEKDEPGGYAGLDEDGKLLPAQQNYAFRGELGDVDLNGVRSPYGIFGQSNPAFATVAHNYPVEGVMGALTVIPLDPTTAPHPMTVQEYRTNENPQRLYIRRGGTAGGWSAWTQVPLVDASGVLPSFSGALLTGVRPGNVVQSLKTDTFTASGTFVPTGLQVVITPSSTSSRIKLDASVNGGGDFANIFFRFTRNGTPIAIADAAGSRERASFGLLPKGTNNIASGAFSYVDTPGTTSAITYDLEMRSGYLNRTHSDSDSSSVGRYVSTLIAMEVHA